MNSCASVPITDRKQLRIIPEAKLNAQASQIYEKIKEKEKLVTKGNDLKMIKDIEIKIIAADINSKKGSLAKAFGSDIFIDSSDNDSYKKIHDITNGGVDTA